MEDSSVSGAHDNNLGSSVASILGIKGGLRFRPHGSTQKAHIILRRVTVSNDSNNDGLGSKVVRFTLIAHKRIEVKPGKELLLMLEAENGPFKDQAVVMEGDLKSSGDRLNKEDNPQDTDKEKFLVPPVKEAIPPKMRRAWAKVDDLTSATSLSKKQPPPLTSVGVQTERSHVSISTQTESLFKDESSQTSSLSTSVSVQVDLPSPIRISSAVQTGLTQCGDVGVFNETELTPVGLNCRGINEDQGPHLIDEEKERSLSPMELDSPSDSPQPSPVVPVSTLSMCIPHLFPLSVPSPIYSPTLSIASSSGAQDMQLSPIDIKPTLHLEDLLSDAKSLPPPINGTLADDSKATAFPSHQNTPAISLATCISPTSDIAMGSEHTVKPAVNNPFVSGGFVTDFGVPFEKPSGSGHGLETKINDSKPSHLLQPRPIPVPSPSSAVKSRVTCPSTAMQNAIASSSKVPSPKIPTRPRIHTRILSGRALEKSPVRDSHKSLPPDPKSLVYIPSGPTSNPLGIRPSVSVAALSKFPRSTPRMPPNAPKTLSTPASAPVKRRLVVGSEWRPFVKATNNNGPAGDLPRSAPVTPSAPPSTPTMTSHIVSYLTPTPPSAAPPPLPSSAPENKWKLVSATLPASPATTSASVPTTPCPPPKNNVSEQDQNGKTPSRIQRSPLLEKAQANSLKDRIAPSSTSLNTSTPSAPVRSNGRDLRSRISDAPALSKTSTPASNSVATSPTSTLVSQSPAPPLSLSSLLSPVVPKNISPVLNHPLPPKPTFVSVKRERPRSPEPVSRKKQRRIFKWPTVDSNYSTRLVGDGQVGVRNIAFSSDGSHFALSCNDRTIRIWNSRNRKEIANLSHNSPVLAVAWMEGDAGVVSLGEDGLVSKWTKSGINHWQWAKVLDAGKNDGRADDDKICLAYVRDRIAVSYPRVGVRVWIWSKGTWQAQRSILRQNVTAITFVDGGAAIIGGTRDGVVWHSDIPNGTLRAYAFLSSRIYTLDLTPSGTHVLVGLGSKAYVVGIHKPGNKGDVERSFSCNEQENRSQSSGTPPDGFGAVFATEGQAVLFGSVEGCVLVWDRKKAVIVYGLEHEEGDTIQAVASFDGPTNREGYLLTGTKSGKLSWWSQPVAAPS
ncbi:hypothetical protein E4T56_gene9735 [Termitomyces sp. T112]|nr:hypothetical protein E4T56_gene9735 [Termitomyces sp. T112]